MISELRHINNVTYFILYRPSVWFALRRSFQTTWVYSILLLTAWGKNTSGFQSTILKPYQLFFLSFISFRSLHYFALYARLSLQSLHSWLLCRHVYCNGCFGWSAQLIFVRSFNIPGYGIRFEGKRRYLLITTHY